MSSLECSRYLDLSPSAFFERIRIMDHPVADSEERQALVCGVFYCPREPTVGARKHPTATASGIRRGSKYRGLLRLDSYHFRQQLRIITLSVCSCVDKHGGSLGIE